MVKKANTTKETIKRHPSTNYVYFSYRIKMKTLMEAKNITTTLIGFKALWNLKSVQKQDIIIHAIILKEVKPDNVSLLSQKFRITQG